jgi:hypothetical protein
VSRRALLLVAAIVSALGLGVVVSLDSRTGTAQHAAPTEAQLEHLQDRINAQLGALARDGVYVPETALAAHCVSVRVINPTAPNVAYLHRRFGTTGMCIDRAHRTSACADLFILHHTRDVRTVPDLHDLGLYTAERRTLAAGFPFAIDCRNQGDRRPRRPAPRTPEALVRVTAQCPRAGARAPVDTPIEITAEAILPGGFRYVVAPARDPGTPRCADRR